MRLPRVLAVMMMVAGVVMMTVGTITYLLVQRELSDENIVVSDDAENFAGDKVEGPFTAYAEATVIKEHSTEIADGLTYAELEREDPRREQVQNASFLRASLFTSVVAFGMSALVVGLGLLFLLAGIGFWSLDKRTLAAADSGPPPPDTSPTTKVEVVTPPAATATVVESDEPPENDTQVDTIESPPPNTV